MNTSVLKNDEKAIFELRKLYEKYGYSQYKMSKFEEYDLYVRNKDFLVSDNIITFTDTNGKLMALKPDVTLSIIKNNGDGEGVKKLYYNENVYRVSKGSHSFKEIMQTGLECIGDIDDYCIYETIMLAAESLNSISEDFVLDVSHLGIVSEVIESMGVSGEVSKKLLSCIGEKNVHGVMAICDEAGVDGSLLSKLVSTYGSFDKVKEVLCELSVAKEAVAQLENVMSALEALGFGDRIRIDFSVINHMSYYNGFVFRGFIKGIASGILSGGQYDKLMQKMGKKCGAIGFAVYLDMLERLSESEITYDVDTVILYDGADLKVLNDAIKLLTANGSSVMAQRSVPDGIRYKQLVKIAERGVEIIENNA